MARGGGGGGGGALAEETGVTILALVRYADGLS